MRLSPPLTTGLIVCLSLGCVLSPGCKRDRNASPRPAAVAFAKAFEDGDVAGALALSAGDETSARVLAVTTEHLAARKRLRVATAVKFGNASAVLPEEKEPDERITEAAGQGREFVEGDTATLTASSSVVSLRLRRVNGEWKVDRGADAHGRPQPRRHPARHPGHHRRLLAGRGQGRAGKVHDAGSGQGGPVAEHVEPENPGGPRESSGDVAVACRDPSDAVTAVRGSGVNRGPVSVPGFPAVAAGKARAGRHASLGQSARDRRVRVIRSGDGDEGTRDGQTRRHSGIPWVAKLPSG